MTDSKSIVSLVTSKKQGNLEVINTLKGLLSEAEAGELVAFAFAATRADGSSQSGCSQSENFQSLLGAVCILKFRMLDESRRAL